MTATNGVGTSAASAASASVKTTSLPAAPTAVSGTGSPEQVSVAFTGDTTRPPRADLTITGYTVTATDVTNPANGGQTATGTASPIVVTGLTDLDEYTFTVHATNSVGNSPESAASSQVAPGGVPSAPLNATAVNVSARRQRPGELEPAGQSRRHHHAVHGDVVDRLEDLHLHRALRRR